IGAALGVRSRGQGRSDLERIRSILEDGSDPAAIAPVDGETSSVEAIGPDEMNPEVKPEISPEVKPEVKPEAESDTNSPLEVEARPEAESATNLESELEANPEVKPEISPEIQPEAELETNPEIASETNPEVALEATPEVNQDAIERLSVIARQPLETDDDRFNLDNFDLDTPTDGLEPGTLKLNSNFATALSAEDIGPIDEPKPSNTPITDLEVARRLAYLQRQPPLLDVEHLKVGFPQRGLFGRARRYTMAVNDVSFQVFPGETLGLVGESGCGKSTLARTLMRLIDPLAGKIRFEDRDILALKPQALRFLRRDMQTIFQDPGNALNPRMSVGAAILEPMQIHNFGAGPKERLDRVKYLLDRVDLDISAINRYPHEFSGGQRQRICIARALALEPKFVICDESVSALDVSVQAQVLNLLKELQEEFGLTYIFISHDLSVVKFMSDRIMVMNQGQIEEIGPADRVYRHPERDYTRKLIASIPRGHLSDRVAS
ncbi:MAG: ATP-binding cassette domain-containing protein, partial [Oscillatoriales cyanobacterium]